VSFPHTGAPSPSATNIRMLLLGALRVPDVAHGLFVGPALFPRLAQTARGRFARLDSPLREVRFHAVSRMARLAARRSFLATRRLL
jgi:hypothetical protein